MDAARGTRTELWFGHGCSGHRMLLEHERNYGLGMDALVTVCSWNTNGIMVWAWMLWSPYALGTRTEYGLGMDARVTVCSWNTNGIMVWAWMLWSPYALGTRTELWFGHGCSGHRLLLEHERCTCQHPAGCPPSNELHVAIVDAVVFSSKCQMKLRRMGHPNRHKGFRV